MAWRFHFPIRNYDFKCRTKLLHINYITIDLEVFIALEVRQRMHIPLPSTDNWYCNEQLFRPIKQLFRGQ